MLERLALVFFLANSKNSVQRSMGAYYPENKLAKPERPLHTGDLERGVRDGWPVVIGLAPGRLSYD